MASRGAQGPAAVGGQARGGQAPGSQAAQGDGGAEEHTGIPGDVLLLACM